MVGTSGNGWVFRKHGLSVKGSLLWRTSCISERTCLPSPLTVPAKLPFVFGSGFPFLPAHSFPSFPITSSLFDLVNISSHDLTSLFSPPPTAFCAGVYSSWRWLIFLIYNGYFAILRAPLAAYFLLKHHIRGRDEPLPHRPECKFNITFSLLSDVRRLSQYLLVWGMRICLFDKFSAQVDFAAVFFRHANGTRQFRTNKFSPLPLFSCFKLFSSSFKYLREPFVTF